MLSCNNIWLGIGTLYAATLGKAQALRVIIYWVGLSIIDIYKYDL